jgi:hypothetical protein
MLQQHLKLGKTTTALGMIQTDQSSNVLKLRNVYNDNAILNTKRKSVLNGMNKRSE